MRGSLQSFSAVGLPTAAGIATGTHVMPPSTERATSPFVPTASPMAPSALNSMSR